jgi:hypothetical protein
VIVTWIFCGFSLHAEESASPVPSELTLAFRERLTLTVPGMKRFLIMQPNNLSGIRNEDRLTLTAGWVGRATLIIWADRRYTVQVTVTRPTLKIYNKKKTYAEKIARQSGVRVQLWYNRSDLASGTSFEEIESEDPYENFGLNLSLPLKWKYRKLSINSGITWDAEESEISLKGWGAQIRDITWPRSQKYTIYLGNITTSGNKLSASGWLRGARIYPLRFRLPWDYSLTMDIFGGKRIRTSSSLFRSVYYSGAEKTDFEPGTVSRSSNTLDRIYGTNMIIHSRNKTDPFLGFHKRYSMAFSRVEAPNGSTTDSSTFTANWQREHWKLYGSVGGLGNVSSSYIYSIMYHRRIRDVSLALSRSVTGTGATSNLGKLLANESYNLSLNYRPRYHWGPLENPSLKWKSVAKRSEKLREEKRELDDFGYEHRLDFSFNLWETPVYLYYNYNDLTNTENPYTTQFAGIKFSRPFRLLRRGGRWGAGYRFSSRDRLNNPLLASDANSYNVHVSCKPFSWLNYGFNYRTTFTENSVAEDRSEVFTHSLSSGHRFFDNRIVNSYGYTYTLSRSGEDITDFTRDTRNQSLYVSLRTSSIPNSSLGLSYRLSLQDSSDPERDDRWIQRFQVSFKSTFYTLFGWKPKTRISARVFFDENADGQFDPETDIPVPDVEVLVNEKPIGQTNAEGRVPEVKIRGFKKIVSLNRDTVPRDYFYTTPRTYTFSSMKSSREECLFGLAVNTEISGTVYNDANENGYYDEHDHPLPNIVVRLKGFKETRTNSYGQYFFNLMPEGEHELMLHPFSIPEGYRSAGKIKATVNAIKGRTVRHDFALLANRILKGRIYVKRPTKRNPATVKGITLKILDRTEKTNSRGEFKFVDLPRGDHELKILTDSVDNIEFEEASPVSIPVSFDHLPATLTLSPVLNEKKNS